MHRLSFFTVFPLFLLALVITGVAVSPSNHIVFRAPTMKPVVKTWLSMPVLRHIPPLTIHPAVPVKVTPTYPYRHIVRPGETLSSIAIHAYGRADYWTVIYRANKHLIGRNYGSISVGWRLKIIKFTGPPPPAPKPPAPPAPPASSPPTSAPAAPSASQPAASSPVSTGGMSSFQACVIQAESGGNPTAVNPSSGAGGLYGFLPSTWAALGHSGLPENASVAEQNQAFQQEYAQSGTAAWAPYDGC